MESEYKSPLKKLVKFFENSRDKWKKKAIDSKQKIKLQRNRIKFLEDSKKKLKQEVFLLKKRLSDLELKQNSSTGQLNKENKKKLQ